MHRPSQAPVRRHRGVSAGLSCAHPGRLSSSTSTVPALAPLSQMRFTRMPAVSATCTAPQHAAQAHARFADGTCCGLSFLGYQGQAVDVNQSLNA